MRVCMFYLQRWTPAFTFEVGCHDCKDNGDECNYNRITLTTVHIDTVPTVGIISFGLYSFSYSWQLVNKVSLPFATVYCV